LISEAVRGEGAKLVDNTGKEFMAKYHDKRELAPRDIVTRAIYNEMQNRKFWIIGNDVQPYEQCVPYNEETKHLKGTTEKAPEFYRI
jgi:aspartate oxidase